MKRRFWSDEEIDYLKENYGKIATQNIANYLDRSYNGILLKANELKLVGHRIIYNKKYTIDDNFFSIPNPINSYIAGFIAADGNIDKNHPRICITQKYKEVLEKIANLLNFNGKIYLRKGYDKCFIRGRKIKSGDCYGMSLTSKKLVDDLYRNFNITSNKSLSLKPPQNLDYYSKLCFIIGLVDGDGCIGIYRHNKSKYMRFGITGTIWLTEWIKEVLNCGYIRISKNKITSTYCCEWNDALRIIGKLRAIEELKYIRFSRKWDKIEDFLEYK